MITPSQTSPTPEAKSSLCFGITVDGEQLCTLVSIIREYYESFLPKSTIRRVMNSKDGLAGKIVETLGDYNEANLKIEYLANGSSHSHIDNSKLVSISLSEDERDVLLLATKKFLGQYLAGWVKNHSEAIRVQLEPRPWAHVYAEKVEQVGLLQHDLSEVRIKISDLEDELYAKKVEVEKLLKRDDLQLLDKGDICNLIHTIHDYYLLSKKSDNGEQLNLINAAKLLRKMAKASKLHKSWIKSLNEIISNLRQVEIIADGIVIKRYSSRNTDAQLRESCKVRAKNTGKKTTFRIVPGKHDPVLQWKKLSESELKAELARYDNIDVLKEAAETILDSYDMKLKTRSVVEKRIINRITGEN